jgi:molybdopterin-guanine dinucleotide biosynthesis adapter protein
MAAQVVAIVGRSGVGKTHLVESLVRRLGAEGVRVATIKHTHHQVFTDKAGSDTERHLRAGARTSALSGPGFCTFFTDGEVPFDLVVGAAGWEVDLVLVEGYKSQKVRKIEVMRDEEPMLAADESWMRVTSDQVAEVFEAVSALIRKPNSPEAGPSNAG